MKAALQKLSGPGCSGCWDYIDRHLDSDLDLETVSGVAAFSKFHFHRQFTATFGLSVHRYVPACPYEARFAPAGLHGRPKRHGHRDGCRLRCTGPPFRPAPFGNGFGQSPSSFRKSPDWEPWLAAFGPLDNARSKLMQKTFYH